MRTSLKGHLLPESLEDFNALVVGKLAQHLTCFDCKAPFTSKNVGTSSRDWAETQISGMCTACWNKLFREEA